MGATLAESAVDLACLVAGPLAETASAIRHPSTRGGERVTYQRHTGASPMPGGAASALTVDIARAARAHRAALRSVVAGPLRPPRTVTPTVRDLLDVAELAMMAGDRDAAHRATRDLGRLAVRAGQLIDRGPVEPAVSDATVDLALGAAAQMPRTVTASQAAAELGVRAGTVRQWANRGRLTPVDQRDGRPAYLLDEVQRLAAA
jgi:hypothetical protein